MKINVNELLDQDCHLISTKPECTAVGEDLDKTPTHKDSESPDTSVRPPLTDHLCQNTSDRPTTDRTRTMLYADI